MQSEAIALSSTQKPNGQVTVLPGPVWSLRVEGRQVSLVLQRVALPGGATLEELVIGLPHVGFPFDFKEGLGQFQHHRGSAESIEIGLEARALLAWLHRRAGGQLHGRAVDDTLILMGRLESGVRYTVRARIVPDPDGLRSGEDEPTVLVSLYELRIYGVTDEPWPMLAARILDLLPESLVVERTLTTARLRIMRHALGWALSGMGWKLPDLATLSASGVEIREGRVLARFATREASEGALVTLNGMPDAGLRAAFERFVEDMELKRHHGQIDRLLVVGQVREALAEVYRAQHGPPRPGFLAERLIGICASRPILYDEGERVCRQILASYPGYIPALCGLASIALGRGRPEEAVVQYERVRESIEGLEGREDATACDLTLAESLREIDPRESRAALQRVLQRSPDHEEALEQLIMLAEDAGDEAATLPLYKRLLFAARSTDRTRDAGLRLAHHALDRKQPEEARVFLRVVLEVAPDDLDARLALAAVEEQQGKREESVALLESALRAVSPTDGDNMMRVVSRLATLALGAGEAGRARRVLWRAADVVGLGDEASLKLASLAIDAEAADLADRYGERILRTSPLWPRAACLRARAWLIRGEPGEALKQVLEVIERYAGDEEALALLERCVTSPEVREGLLPVLKRAVDNARKPADRVRVLRSLGQLYESLDLDWDALKPYEEVLQGGQGVDASVAAERLLELYARFGMWPKHQSLVARLLSISASDALERVPLLIRAGRVALLELGDPQTAESSLKEAVSLAPRSLKALELLRDAHERLAHWEELVPVLRRLARVHSNDGVRAASMVRLAEIQLDSLGARNQARATLAQIPPSEAANSRVRSLRQRLLEPAVSPTNEQVPTDEGASWERAVALADRGDLDAALQVLEHEGTLTSPVPAALELGWFLAQDNGRVDAALSFGERLVGLGDAETQQRLLAELLVLASREGREQATDYASRLLSLDPHHERARSVLSKAGKLNPLFSGSGSAVRENESLGRFADEASESVAPAQDERVRDTRLPKPVALRVMEGDRLEALLKEASMHVANQQWADAESVLKVVLEIDEDCVEALELQVVQLRRTGSWEALALHLSRLADLAFDAVQTLAYTRERAEVLADRLHQYEDAAVAWKQYLDFAPFDDVVMSRLVSWYQEQGNYEALVALYARRAEAAAQAAKETTEPGTHYQRVIVRARLKEARVRLGELSDPAGALEALAEPLAFAPNEPEVLECQVRALAAGNQRSACREAVHKLLPMLLPGPLRDEMALFAE